MATTGPLLQAEIGTDPEGLASRVALLHAEIGADPEALALRGALVAGLTSENQGVPVAEQIDGLRQALADERKERQLENGKLLKSLEAFGRADVARIVSSDVMQKLMDAIALMGSQQDAKLGVLKTQLEAQHTGELVLLPRAMKELQARLDSVQSSADMAQAETAALLQQQLDLQLHEQLGEVRAEWRAALSQELGAWQEEKEIWCSRAELARLTNRLAVAEERFKQVSFLDTIEEDEDPPSPIKETQEIADATDAASLRSLSDTVVRLESRFNTENTDVQQIHTSIQLEVSNVRADVRRLLAVDMYAMQSNVQKLLVQSDVAGRELENFKKQSDEVLRKETEGRMQGDLKVERACLEQVHERDARLTGLQEDAQGQMALLQELARHLSRLQLQLQQQQQQQQPRDNSAASSEVPEITQRMNGQHQSNSSHADSSATEDPSETPQVKLQQRLQSLLDKIDGKCMEGLGPDLEYLTTHLSADQTRPENVDFSSRSERTAVPHAVMQASMQALQTLRSQQPSRFGGERPAPTLVQQPAELWPLPRALPSCGSGSSGQAPGVGSISSEVDEAMQGLKDTSMRSLKEEVLTFLRSEFHDQISDTLRKIQTEVPPQHSSDTTPQAAIVAVSEERPLHHTPLLSHRPPLKPAAVLDPCPSPPITPRVLCTGSASIDTAAFVEVIRTPRLSHRSPLQSARGLLGASDGLASSSNPGTRSQVRRLASTDAPRMYSIGAENHAGAPSNPSIALSRSLGMATLSKNPVASPGGSVSVGMPVSRGNSMSVPVALGAMSVPHPGGKGAADNANPYLGSSMSVPVASGAMSPPHPGGKGAAGNATPFLGSSMSVPVASGAMSVPHPGGKGAAGNAISFLGSSMSVPITPGAMSVPHPGGKGAAGNANPFLGSSMSVPVASGATSVPHPGGKGAAGNANPFLGSSMSVPATSAAMSVPHPGVGGKGATSPRRWRSIGSCG